MANDKPLRIKRGPSSRMPTLVDGEVVFTKDNNKLHINNNGKVVSFINEELILKMIREIELTPGAQGNSLEFKWDGTALGIKKEGDADYHYVDLKGESIAFEWKGTELGVKLNKDETYTYSDLGYKIPSGSTEERPGEVYLSFLFYDTTLKKPIWWNGESWTDAMGETV